MNSVALALAVRATAASQLTAQHGRSRGRPVFLGLGQRILLILLIVTPLGQLVQLQPRKRIRSDSNAIKDRLQEEEVH